MRDVIVLLPGITGSVLQKDDKDVWAFSGGAIIRALLSLGGSVKDLALTDDPPDEDDLGDGVTADRVMPDIHLIPGFWKIDGYGKVATAIEEAFDVRRGENFFEFPYDWRRDNRVAARKLARDTHDWLSAWRESSGNDDAKLILVGHSMGGIVSRYFVEVLDGWRDTRMLVTFGTPYRGSLNALGFLVNGMAKKLGFLLPGSRGARPGTGRRGGRHPERGPGEGPGRAGLPSGDRGGRRRPPDGRCLPPGPVRDPSGSGHLPAHVTVGPAGR
jgi:pimeloyl-ACP methyl ester carboxylesterase